MNNLKPAALFVLILLVGVSSLPQSAKWEKDSKELAIVRISTLKAEYSLGEPVTLDRRFTKKKEFRAQFGDESIASRAFRVFIARDGGEFRQYKFGGEVAGRKSSMDGADRVSSDTIFFNSKPETGHLSEFGRREAEQGMILTDYAFPEPGTYRLKATWVFTRLAEGNAIWEKIESNEITIRVTQPEGDDLKIWEIIRSDPRIGYFMTCGSAPYRFPSIQDSLLAEIDKITADYPSSYLSGILKEKVAKRKARLLSIQKQNDDFRQQ